MRFLLAPRQLAVSALALAAIALMISLGGWQLDRARSTDAEMPEAPPVALESVSSVGRAPAEGAYGSTVRIAGRYDATGQLLVPRPDGDDTDVFWVLLPLRLPDGSVVPVVRGQVDDRAEAAAPDAASTVEVVGTFLPSQDIAPGAAPPALGEVPAIDITTLAQRWGAPLHEGFVVAREETPAPPPVPTRIPRTEAVAAATKAPFTNFGYALQWWVFAAFVLYMWWRVLRDNYRTRAGSPGDADVAAPVPTAPRS